jgi:hypothetical protein
MPAALAVRSAPGSQIGRLRKAAAVAQSARAFRGAEADSNVAIKEGSVELTQTMLSSLASYGVICRVRHDGQKDGEYRLYICMDNG